MNMRNTLQKLAQGKISVAEAEKNLRLFSIEEIGELARIDVCREFRKGVPEIILAEGKTPKDVADIVLKVSEKKESVVVSRVSPQQVLALKKAVKNRVLLVNEKARTVLVRKKSFHPTKTGGRVGIITGGTSDIPVAEEARIIAEEMGCETVTAYDVGVAGIHRVFPALKKMTERDVDVIVIAVGREGALPSVISGMVDVPIIAVPTSNSYGLGARGVSTLMALLQSCSLGISVVNIDGGIVAGTAAALIANRAAKFRR